MNDQFDLTVIGGGLAGMTAGLYASRAGLQTILLERMMPGGQIINTETIENLPGFPEGLSGPQLGLAVQEQATKYGLNIELSEVSSINPEDNVWSVTAYDNVISSKAVILAGGSTLKKLGIPGEERLHGNGVSYCATCDGAFFNDETVGVVGGGDSALDESIVLTEFASKVFLFNRTNKFAGQKILQDKVRSNPDIEVVCDTEITEIIGGLQVEGVKTQNANTGEVSLVNLTGLFVYVGLQPNTSYLGSVVELDNAGHVPTDIWMRTPIPGLLAAGDIRQDSASQLVTAAGDGATAAIAAQRYLETGSWIR